MSDASKTPPDLAELARVFWRIGLLSFGGPAAQIALMQRELVAARAWLSEAQFLSALSFCMILPGPEAMQLAAYTGWRLGGWRGGLIAGGLFILPGAAVMMVLAAAYAAFGDLPLVQALFLGIKAAVVVIVIEAVIRLSRRALKGALAYGLALLAFVAIFVADLPFPLILGVAAVVGALAFGQSAVADHGRAVPVSLRATARVAGLWAAVWLAPLAAVILVAPDHILAEIGRFFAALALITFGGAYAVLAYMAQEVVAGLAWITPSQMMDALGLAEATPGPLILVTQFVAYLAAEAQGGHVLGVMGAALALWMTFIPSFLFIFAGAPYLTHLAQNPRLAGAMAGITAAVVGVILNLSLWFALNVWFGAVDRIGGGHWGIWWPDTGRVDLAALALSGLAAGLLWGLRLDLMRLVPIMAAFGVAFSLIRG